MGNFINNCKHAMLTEVYTGYSEVVQPNRTHGRRRALVAFLARHQSRGSCSRNVMGEPNRADAAVYSV